MKRIIIPGAILGAVALAGCVTEDVPAGAPPTVTSTCVEFQDGSHFSAASNGLWVWRYVGNGVDVYGWTPTEDSYCGPEAMNMVWDAGW